MADLAKLVDDLSSLTLLEAAELTKMLEEKWGVKQNYADWKAALTGDDGILAVAGERSSVPANTSVKSHTLSH